MKRGRKKIKKNKYILVIVNRGYNQENILLLSVVITNLKFVLNIILLFKFDNLY